MANRRLFIGAQLNSELQEDLKQVYQKLKISAQNREYNIRWSPIENWHITLQFLGNADEYLIPKIGEALDQAAAQVCRFSVRASGVGAFPEERRARVIWVGIARTQELLDLQSTIELATAPLGFVAEESEFHPHITLGRLRSTGSVSDLISPFVRKKFEDFELSELTLFESTMHGLFPHYKPLHQTKLAECIVSE